MYGEIIPTDCLKYHITSTGKIYGLKREELMKGDSQKRRELLGNSFDTPEAAALAKAKQEARTRLTPYVSKELRVIDGELAIIEKFHFTDEERDLLRGDVILLAQT